MSRNIPGNRRPQITLSTPRSYLPPPPPPQPSVCRRSRQQWFETFLNMATMYTVMEYENLGDATPCRLRFNDHNLRRCTDIRLTLRIFISHVWQIRCNISSFSCAPANTILRFNIAGIKVQCQHDDNRSNPVRIITVHFHRVSSPYVTILLLFLRSRHSPIDSATQGLLTIHAGMSCIIPSSTVYPFSKYFANQHRTQQSLKQQPFVNLTCG